MPTVLSFCWLFPFLITLDYHLSICSNIDGCCSHFFQFVMEICSLHKIYVKYGFICLIIILFPGYTCRVICICVTRMWSLCMHLGTEMHGFFSALLESALLKWMGFLFHKWLSVVLFYCKYFIIYRMGVNVRFVLILYKRQRHDMQC